MQAIEAAWRALFMLVRGLDTDSNLKLYVLNITLPELIAEMDTVRKDLKRKGPWAVIVGNFAFGQGELDAQVLRRLGGLASSVGAPFVAEAHLHGKDVAEETWSGLRHSPQARWIGLALPRFLLRLPYGKDTRSIESFQFEEMPKSEHSAYLWGNPAFLCAYLLGKSFLKRGWDLNPIERRIDGLPMHVYHEDGEPVAKPCAEVLMTEREAESLLDAGFMPLASMKHEPAALLVRVQSIAEPLAPLSGLS
jgi:type VI secretion system protein ImpC